MNSAEFHSVKDALLTLELFSERYPPESKTVYVDSLQPGRILAENIETMDRKRILRDGSTLSLNSIELLQKLGIEQIEIYRKSRVCVLSAGNEVSHQTTRSQLLTMFSSQGFKAIDAGGVKEKPSRIEKQLRVAANFACVIVVVGGAEIVQRTIRKLDLTTIIRGVDVNPGNFHFSYGSIDSKTVFVCSLPSDWHCTWIGANLFVSPLLRAMEGRTVTKSLKLKAILTTSIAKSSNHRLLRSRTESSDANLTVAPIFDNGSVANSILEVPKDTCFSKGDCIYVILIEF